MSQVDLAWILFCSATVMSMQAGFTCLEAGLVRAKNGINVALKNVVDFAIATLFFWAFGFAIMFGPELPGGRSAWFMDAESNLGLMPFFVFQLMFCGTATTLIAGALAERTRYASYLLIAVLVSTLIYPIIGRWTWAGLLPGNEPSWLETLGFYDFGGATVVHSSGSWVALAAVLLVGPRLGRFGKGAGPIRGHNLPLASLGVLLLWVGWLGFNGGSLLTLNDRVPLIVFHTVLSGAAGGAVGHLLGWRIRGVFDVTTTFNGVIAGLVGITASSNVVSSAGAASIGVVAGILSVCTERLMVRWRIDDAIGVLSAHLAPGIWGTLAVAIFGDLEMLPATTRFEQLSAQAAGVVVCGAWCFGVSYIALAALNRVFPLRVSREEELAGLNMSQHGASTEVSDLLVSMAEQRHSGDFSTPIEVSPYTETGQIACEYNHVMASVVEHQDALENANAELRDKQLSYSAMDHLLDALLTCDERGRILQFNAAAVALFGHDDAFLQRQTIAALIPAIRLMNSAERPTEYEALRADGSAFEGEVSVRHFTHDGQRKYVVLVRDVSERKEMERRLHHSAHHDALTGLPNRILLDDRLERAMTRARRQDTLLSVLFLDVDGFKPINDTYGHAAGDALLQQIAIRLQRGVRESDTVARIGGDEFVMVLEDVGSLSNTLVIAQKILDDMTRPFPLKLERQEVVTQVGLSIGVSGVHGGHEAAGDLLRQADEAMYASKRAGRNRFTLHETRAA